MCDFFHELWEDERRSIAEPALAPDSLLVLTEKSCELNATPYMAAIIVPDSLHFLSQVEHALLTIA